MPFELVNDDISDHAPLDAKVYAACESDCSKEPPPLGLLLNEVLMNTPDKMIRDFIVARQILEEYSQDPGADEYSNLKKLLRSCWQLGSFEKIRRLSEHGPTTRYSYAISYKTAEILRPTPMPVYHKAGLEKINRYA